MTMATDHLATGAAHHADAQSAFSLFGRRDFLTTLGAGVFVFFTVRDADAQGHPGPPPLPTDPNAFLRIGEDGRVTCFTGKIEMGQGVVSSLALMLADELDAPLEAVDMVMGDTARCPWDMGTFGSLTTRAFAPSLRAAAAEARAVLIALAAERLGVPAGQLATKAGAVVDTRSPDRKIGFGQLTRGKAIARFVGPKPALKGRSELQLTGRPLLRRDALEKVSGKAQFAGDVRLPGMLYAAVLRPPAHGATLVKLDASAAKEIAGAQVVELGGLVAVLHTLPDVAERALHAIRAEHQPPPPGPDDTTIFDHLLKVAPAPMIVAQAGDLAAGEKLASAWHEATYLNSYVAHAAIETHTALAQVERDRATVWASTQNPFTAQKEVAEAVGLPVDKVRVITPFVGGGFGGKTNNRQAIEAARLSKAVGRPVQVAWSRAEEFFYDTFRPAALVKIRSGLDARASWRAGITKSSTPATGAASSSTTCPTTARGLSARAGRARPGCTRWPQAPGAPRATTRTPSRASRRSTPWRRSRTRTRSTSGSGTSPTRGCSRC
jgi:nicotinate dehydrogenase subunit B